MGLYDKGPVDILCKEIGFRYSKQLETPDIMTAFVRQLVRQVENMRDMQSDLAAFTKDGAPSATSAEVLARTKVLVEATRAPDQMVNMAVEVHDFIYTVHDDEYGPTDHLIDMLSSCVSAVRFGFERPCKSRHAAEAAQHIWKHVYGVSLFDQFTSNWSRDWARAQLDTAILSLVPTQGETQ